MLESGFKFPKQTAFYKGKVRDVYTIEDKTMVMVASDRISAFDVVLPRPIPFKGQVLNQVAAIMLNATRDIVPNWVKAVPLPNVTIGLKCETFPVEMVVRGNLTGHAWRTYKSGKRELCGVTMPEGLKENDFFPTPIITPTTKAHEGHDEDISREDIIAKGLVTKEDYEQLEKYTLALFARGKELAAARGLILVDTKYEFGKIGDTIYVIDEIHTPDSSRYFYAEGYEEKQKADEPQKQLSKEFVREWLMANGFQGKDGQQVPEMTDEFVSTVSERYIELFENITGQQFVKETVSEADSEKKIIETLDSL
jgi:phosphoribosylaminoimidazole-succinocarboxamide synthase